MPPPRTPKKKPTIMATQTTTRRSRTEGTPAPPGAYPPQPSSSFIPTTSPYAHRRSSSAPAGMPPPDPSSDDETDDSIKGEDDNHQDDNPHDNPHDDDPHDDYNHRDTTPKPDKYQLNTREDFSGDVPLPPKNTREGQFKELVVFDDWCLKIMDLFTLKGILLMDPKAIIRIGFYLDGKASEFHNNWRSQPGNKGVKSFLEDLRTWVIPRNYEHRLWSEFHRIK